MNQYTLETLIGTLEDVLKQTIRREQRAFRPETQAAYRAVNDKLALMFVVAEQTLTERGRTNAARRRTKS